MAILKLLHILFVFIWVGTLLTQTCILGYFSLQERIIQSIKRLYLLVDLPAMILSVIFGALLLIFKEDINWKAPWLHMKLTFAFLLIMCDLLTGKIIVKQANTSKQIKPITYKIFHLIIGILLIAILIAIYIFKSALS